MNAMALPDAVLERLQISSSSRRKSIGIKVGPEGVRVLKPSSVSRADVMRLLQGRRQWLLEKLALQQQRLDERPDHHYGDGDSFAFLGQNLSLKISQGARENRVVREGDILLINLSSRGRKPAAERVRELLCQWYMAQALEYLGALSLRYAEQIGQRVGSVKVKLTRSKWGHCSRAGDLQYNWLILLAPVPVIEYLVAHEVSHLVHMNHSRDFWQQVAELCPDYLASRRWLKQQGHRLVI
ncbi:SprT family zinc-dependent metalloprotease [Simiduia curdlanivorans]|uniref:M48 family metallopeptidase n=1 Tax=Simiduia curdlanivorans TaxID=1492769 RepID=A0ABV8V5H1_9GAMM|nr:SprT family zinc-dependent metalloprotease [Simiduia curdlanivorans]MDN3638167.1 SprT family zinc-dependent metalloprotease [Simiduia curdlanivorans]